MTLNRSNGRMRCGTHVDRGTCDNRRTVVEAVLRERVIGGLKTKLTSPEMVQAFADEVVAEIKRFNETRDGASKKAKAELAETERKLSRLVEAISAHGHTEVLLQELAKLEQRQKALRAEIAGMAAPKRVPEVPPDLPALFRKTVDDLEAKLADPAIAEVARATVRTIVDRIAIHPGAGRGQYRIELTGDMAALAGATNETAQSASPASGENAAGSKVEDVSKVVSLVAAGRFELPTKGL
jgi:site-specific DNA recombinase